MAAAFITSRNTWWLRQICAEHLTCSNGKLCHLAVKASPMLWIAVVARSSSTRARRAPLIFCDTQVCLMSQAPMAIFHFDCLDRCLAGSL